MTIESENYKPLMTFVIVLGVMLPVFYAIEFGEINTFVICHLVLDCIFIVPRWISTGRTYVFDQTGCTVKFLCYHKTYRWEDLKVKRYVYSEYCLKYGRQVYKYSAEFSAKNIRRPKWMHPGKYCELTNPLSFIYVNFRPISQSDKKAAQYYPFFYPVDGLEFKKKMKEWGVDMDNA